MSDIKANRKNLNKLKMSILILLYRSINGLTAFYIFKKLGVSYPIFSENIFSLVNDDYIYEKDAKLFLNEQFKLDLKFSVIAATNYTDKPWRKMPEEFKENSHPINDAYIPSRRLYLTHIENQLSSE